MRGEISKQPASSKPKTGSKKRSSITGSPNVARGQKGGSERCVSTRCEPAPTAPSIMYDTFHPEPCHPANSLESGTVGWELVSRSKTIDKPSEFVRLLFAFVARFCIWEKLRP